MWRGAAIRIDMGCVFGADLSELLIWVGFIAELLLK
jgi:hypothetical protein